MALLINDACTACDACKPVCPNEAISVGDPIYVIDPFKCTECVGAHDEPQCKLVCPADTAYGDQGSFPGADACFERALALPFHTQLTESELDRVAEALTVLVIE